MPEEKNSTHIEIWNRVLQTALNIPGARVNRAAFLKKELSPHVTEEQVKIAIESRPSLAKIPKETIKKISRSCINWHTAQAATLSFVAGIPGGWAMAGTIPADLSQLYWHVIVLVQKLAYLYGWPEFAEEGQVDDQTLMEITLFIGVMSGVKGASKAIATLAQKLSLQVVKRLPRQALTKYAIYNIAKQVAKWLGISLTKKTFSQAIAKSIPVLGGFISGTITIFTIKPMSRRLRRHLSKLPLANNS